MDPTRQDGRGRTPFPAAKPFSDGPRSRWGKRNWDVVVVTVLLLIFLVVVFAFAYVLQGRYSESLPDEVSPSASRDLEVIRTCLQVMGVVCVGAFVTLGGAALESARRKRAEREASRREDFETRTAMLDRAMRCAQGMFVACQNARRRFDDLDETGVERRSPLSPDAAEIARAEVQRELDERYVDFGVEARAIQTIIGARYTTTVSPEPMPDEDAETGIEVGEDQAWWRWHQVYDLLVVYYFSISGNFRRNVLRTNSRGHNGQFHAGYDFDAANFKDDAERPNFGEIEKAIRYEFPLALSEFAASLTGKATTARPKDPQW